MENWSTGAHFSIQLHKDTPTKIYFEFIRIYAKPKTLHLKHEKTLDQRDYTRVWGPKYKRPLRETYHGSQIFKRWSAPPPFCFEILWTETYVYNLMCSITCDCKLHPETYKWGRGDAFFPPSRYPRQDIFSDRPEKYTIIWLIRQDKKRETRVGIN